MPANNIEISDEELTLMISSLELAAQLMPEAEVNDSKLLSIRMDQVDRLTRRLTGIAINRGLRTI